MKSRSILPATVVFAGSPYRMTSWLQLTVLCANFTMRNATLQGATMLNISLNFILLALLVAIVGCAAGYGQKREEMWKANIAMNRCEQGFEAYCNENTGV
jgi:hypothetical protein